jgi:hypothetical protein
MRGRVVSVFGAVIYLYVGRKYFISLKYVECTQTLRIDSLVSENRYLRKDNNGHIFVKEKT